ncbi:MAG TPA: carboxypeptidase-like regulatory domain-containing protein, partial [Pyrinomonadaceae bacterium]|nr:carboxypeptidase-like regulatory domain-containing protein [Pyrinomonadaceae bacterium]
MMRRRPFALHASLLACSVFALCTLPFAARGQTATATLSGTVEDENGAIIPGVAITAVNNGTQLTRQTTTDENGYFVIPLLSPGSYTVKAQGKGFAPVDFT